MAELMPTSCFSLTLRLHLPNRSGMLAKVTQTIATVGGNLDQIDLVDRTRWISVRDITVDAASVEQAEKIIHQVRQLPDVEVLSVYDRTFNLHRGGKISVQSKIPLRTQAELAMAYTPGVGRVCRAIAEVPDQVYALTVKQNMVAIVTDGSAVLGLGNLGSEAALPVMEGKAMLFKEFGGVDAFPICLATQDPDAMVATIKNIAPVFGGINLEDIAAPRCFEVETRLKQELDIPVFHDDQHGTAVVVLAALTNALKLVRKSLKQAKIVVNGAGAAGLAVAGLLRKAGADEIYLCDSRGLLSKDRGDLTPQKKAFAVSATGSLTDVLPGADVFLGLSGPGVLTPAMVQTMVKDPIIFAMANPVPEIQPELVADAVAVMATGRSDYPNQINNVLAFPGIFRGALDCRASTLTTAMYMAAAEAIASLVAPQDLSVDYIVPSVFDDRVVPAVAAAVQQAAREAGVARR